MRLGAGSKHLLYAHTLEEARYCFLQWRCFSHVTDEWETVMKRITGCSLFGLPDRSNRNIKARCGRPWGDWYCMSEILWRSSWVYGWACDVCRLQTKNPLSRTVLRHIPDTTQGVQVTTYSKVRAAAFYDAGERSLCTRCVRSYHKFLDSRGIAKTTSDAGGRDQSMLAWRDVNFPFLDDIEHFDTWLAHLLTTRPPRLLIRRDRS